MNFLIWSFEHEAWWKPAAHGYTKEKALAGRFTLEKALEYCQDANKASGDTPDEAIVPEY